MVDMQMIKADAAPFPLRHCDCEQSETGAGSKEREKEGEADVVVIQFGLAI